MPPGQFVAGEAGRQRLTSLLQAYLNVSYVDVFTVLPALSGQATGVSPPIVAGQPRGASWHRLLPTPRRRRPLDKSPPAGLPPAVIGNIKLLQKPPSRAVPVQPVLPVI